MDGYEKFQCTWYVDSEWQKRYSTNVLKWLPRDGTRRDAKTFLNRAREAGMRVTTNSHEALPGSVVVFPTVGAYGHVAIVEVVKINGAIDISEFNFKEPDTFGKRYGVFSGWAGFILPPQDTEELDAWNRLIARGVFTEATKHGSSVPIERLAVFLDRNHRLP